MSAPYLVVIPCLNEETHLPALLQALQADPSARGACIVVADGGSTDGSADIVRAEAAQNPNLVLMHNAKRIQSAGTNMAVAAYGDDCPFFIRLDAHAHYPAGFLARLIDAYNTSTADSVTVAMRAVAAPDAFFQAAVATAQNSVLGNGGSAHRAAGVRRWIDHGHHALFRTAMFRSVGGYDESFTHNEDAELDTRIVAAGGRILLAADIVMDYFPRATAWGLAKQYFNFGKGRAKTVMKHRTRPKLRQLAPVAVAPAALLALLAPLTPLAAVPLALWLALCLAYGLVLGLREGAPSAAFSGVAAALMHFAWSFGFWRQLLFSGGRAGTPARSQPTSAPGKA